MGVCVRRHGFSISKIVDRPVNIAVALSCLRAEKLGGKSGSRVYVLAVLTTVFKNKNGASKETFCSSYKSKMKLENSL